MNKIKIGLPSKGRLKDESIKLFSSKGLNIQNTNSRNYFFNFESKAAKMNGKIVVTSACSVTWRAF